MRPKWDVAMMSHAGWGTIYKNLKKFYRQVFTVSYLLNAFQKILDSSKSNEAKSKRCKPYKVWVDQGGEFYNNLYKKDSSK